MRFGRSCFVLALLLIGGVARGELKPEQIALIVNAQVPESEKIAQFYCKARGVPESQIISLNLPAGDEIIFDSFEQYVRPTVRQWLATHQTLSIRCLVTCYGVPLRIGERVNSPRENNEVNQLQSLQRELLNQLAQLTTDAEAKATAIDPNGAAASSQPSDLLARIARAAAILQAAAQRGGPTGGAANAAMVHLTSELRKPVTSENVLLSAPPPTTAPTPAAVADWAARPFDDAARSSLRSFAQQKLGLLELIKIVAGQNQYLLPNASGAAFDSELALVEWPSYPHANWLSNPLMVGYRGQVLPTLMTARLDAPTPQGVRDLIATSIEVERTGLSGKMVIDTRGLPAIDANGKPDPYGVFDERLRKLATLLREKSSLPVVLDEQPAVLAPGSVDDVAAYVGWYSLRKYVPGMKFARGAVGYHVASFELVNLRNPRETGWVRGLLNDGVVATSGPVAEPYLHSFPAPEVYFPLLLSGHASMAEVYWASTPLVSWMQAMIGDPLYTPFAKTPAMKVEDLPPALAAWIKARGADGR